MGEAINNEAVDMIQFNVLITNRYFDIDGISKHNYIAWQAESTFIQKSIRC